MQWRMRPPLCSDASASDYSEKTCLIQRSAPMAVPVPGTSIPPAWPPPLPPIPTTFDSSLLISSPSLFRSQGLCCCSLCLDTVPCVAWLAPVSALQRGLHLPQAPLLHFVQLPLQLSPQSLPARVPCSHIHFCPLYVEAGEPCLSLPCPWTQCSARHVAGAQGPFAEQMKSHTGAQLWPGPLLQGKTAPAVCRALFQGAQGWRG